MDKLTPQLIWYIILFFAPGFLASFWIQRYIPKQQGDSDGKNLLSYISLSIILYSPLLIWMAIKRELPYVGSQSNFIWLVATTFVFPILLSMLFGWAIQNDWVGKIFRQIGLKPKRFTATAWEEYFSQNPAVALIVTMDDGKQVAGVFMGEAATASSDPNERDLYIPFVCNVSNGSWTLALNTAGILIRANKIAHIEFFNLAQLTAGTQVLGTNENERIEPQVAGG